MHGRCGRARPVGCIAIYCIGIGVSVSVMHVGVCPACPSLRPAGRPVVNLRERMDHHDLPWSSSPIHYFSSMLPRRPKQEQLAIADGREKHRGHPDRTYPGAPPPPADTDDANKKKLSDKTGAINISTRSRSLISSHPPLLLHSLLALPVQRSSSTS